MASDAGAPETAAANGDAPPRRRHRAGKRLRRFLVFALALPPAALVSRLPLSVARALARVVGAAAYLVARKERAIALENLEAAFGDELGAAELRSLTRRVFIHASVAVADAIVIRRWSKEKIERRFAIRAAVEHAANEMAGGTVGITAHFGNWELLGIIFAHFAPGTLVPVATRNSNEHIQRHLENFRERIGLDVIYTDSSPRSLFRALRDGRILGILPDQDLRTPNGVFVDFFGRPAYTTTLPVNLARSSGRRMTVCLLARDGDGFRIILEHVPLEWTGERAADFERITLAWSKVLEREIRARPEQWLWFHRRWRTQPGEQRHRGRARWVRKVRERGEAGRRAGE